MPHPSNRSAIELFVRRLKAHSELSSAECEAILALPVQTQHLRANADFVRFGEVVDHTCLIGEGLVAKFGQTEDGRRQIVSIHIPGEAADLPSVMVPQSATAMSTLAATTIHRIAHRDLRELGLRFPAVAAAFWRNCVLDAAVVTQWLINVGRRDARSRLAHLFCEMAVRYRLLDQSDGRQYALPMTQEQLGDALGLTPVHVNRTLQSLREDRLIAVDRGRVSILEWDGLAAAGDFDTTYLQVVRG